MYKFFIRLACVVHSIKQDWKVHSKSSLKFEAQSAWHFPDPYFLIVSTEIITIYFL